MYEQSSKDAAHELETELIMQYGRRDLGTGTLDNRTNGLGSAGRQRTEEERKRLAEAQRGRKKTDEQREAISKRLIGNTHLLGHVHSEETRAKISAAGKGKRLQISDEERVRRSERMR